MPKSQGAVSLSCSSLRFVHNFVLSKSSFLHSSQCLFLVVMLSLAFSLSRHLPFLHDMVGNFSLVSAWTGKKWIRGHVGVIFYVVCSQSLVLVQHISRVLSLPVTVLELHQFLHSRFYSSLFYVLSPFSFLRILLFLLLLTPVYSSASTTVTHSLCLFSLIQNEPLLPLCFAVCIPSASLFSRSSTGIRFLALLPMPPTCHVRISKPAPTLKEKSPPCLFIFLHFVVLYLHLCHLLLFFSTPSIASISANWHFYRFLFLFS